MQCISVDLPEPDGPMIAVSWPAGMSTVTSSSARTAVSPVPYTLVAASARAAARVGASVSVVMGSSWRDRTSSLKGSGRRVVRSPDGTSAYVPRGGAGRERRRAYSQGSTRESRPQPDVFPGPTPYAGRDAHAHGDRRASGTAVRRRVRVDALIVVVVGFIEIFGTAMAAQGQDRGDMPFFGMALLGLGRARAAVAAPAPGRGAVVGARHDAHVLVARLSPGAGLLRAARRVRSRSCSPGTAAPRSRARSSASSGFSWLGYVIGRDGRAGVGRGGRPRGVADRAAERHRAGAQPARPGPRPGARPSRTRCCAGRRRAHAHRPRAARRGRPQHVAHQHPGRRRAAPHGRRPGAGARRR